MRQMMLWTKYKSLVGTYVLAHYGESVGLKGLYFAIGYGGFVPTKPNAIFVSYLSSSRSSHSSLYPLESGRQATPRSPTDTLQ